MRSGNWRGVLLAAALAAVVIANPMTSAMADGGLWHTIPREVPAVDFRTGDVMMAPPIPYGEYTKDYAGAVHGGIGLAAGAVHGLIGKACGLCGGAACGSCGGQGHLGNGSGCGDCGGDGCGRCGGGLFGGLFSGHKSGLGHSGCGDAACGGGVGHGLLGGGLGKHGLLGHGHKAGGFSLCGGPGQTPCASPQGIVLPTGQGAPSAQSMSNPCGKCGGFGLLGARSCGLCNGSGLLGGLGGACNGCGGKGLLGGSPCGGCGGQGLLSGLHNKNACGSCGGAGRLHDGSKCGGCGGTGLIHQLVGLPHHLLGTVHSAAASALHVGDIEYFVGPGGPVPLTPGYVPYVVPTRSPRDFFAFPPFTDRAFP